jgi:SAM-dependent methyltransferase
MPIYHSKKFRESPLAHKLLDGLQGLEIGGAAHNAFGLDTMNVDRVHHTSLAFEPYALEQVRLCGEVMPVDIVAPGDKIPVKDGSFDFVINSHVIEHFYDPISAIKEWMRISRQYVFMIIPQRDALESDKEKPLTPLSEHIERYHEQQGGTSDDHHSRWTAITFREMCEWIFAQDWGKDWIICAVEYPDKKVGNGFTVVLQRAPGYLDAINKMEEEHRVNSIKKSKRP